MVISHHLISTGFIPDSSNVRLFQVFINGHIGVNVFFVISGFLITKLLLIEEEKHGIVSLHNFYTRRVLRIFPAYYFMLLVCFILQLAGLLHITMDSWLTNLTFTKQFIYSKDWETRCLWSISVEEVFYLFWPFIFSHLKQYRIKIAVTIVVVIVLLRIVLLKFPTPGMNQLTIFYRGDALMIGCLLAIYYNRIASWVIQGKTTVKLGLAVIALALSQALPDIFTHLPVQHVSLIISTLFGSIGVFTNLLVAYIIVASVNLNNYWYGFLNSKSANYVGKLSYSIYLWQQFFVSYRPVFHQLPVPVILLIILTVASISYYLIEKPFLRYKTKFA
jgi:peptidoglycan/LPS O-acetylase OafA/YrhL